MRRRSITIKDIARQLGMSHSTVSRALTGSGKISAETRETVLEAAGRLQYVANSSARLMRRSSGTLVGLVVPDIKMDFYTTVAKRLAEKCRLDDFQMVLSITEDDSAIEEDSIKSLIEARAVGVVISPTIDMHENTAALLKMIPTVQIVRQVPSIGATLRMDDVSAIAMAAEHLLSLGHRRLGYIGINPERTSGQTRREGFIRAHAARGVPPFEEAVFMGEPTRDFGAQAARLLLALPERPTAVILGNSELAFGALTVLREAEVAIPGEMSVVAYGDPQWFQLLDPALTAIRLPLDELADMTAQRLFRLIRNDGAPDPDAAENYLLKPELIVRASTMPIGQPQGGG
ncbi:MAG TPA: LacI family DNA-binding transcriptional regulator [Bosea sp. (in: a-proteobacteria)]|jgi:LacI family transcriptional regulator|uniref:LacI family DNA-binding transcriptional regulator n=1 Tax=Bosea sp. (in: a-proteobacteria) TaxID=1871050 RepID=UPI002E164A87|nr:LacI family DNA-binding transcriptional regulator [Bosea sp. (in: a-proteobacteria)]